jgi:O-antigen ligase
MNDPNTFGGSVVYALPLLAPLWYWLTGRKWRIMMAGYFALSVLCVALTGSRSAMVALVAYFALIVLAERRLRSRALLLMVLGSPAAWFLMPEGLQNRFYSIIDPSVVDAGARASAEERGEGLRVGFELLQRFPLTGCGPGVWRPATRRLIESHNLYGQLMGEMGLLGLVPFSAIVFLLFWNARRIKAAYRAHPWWEKDFLYHLAHAVMMAVILLLVLGYGAHSLFRFTWIWYGAFLIVARDCLNQRLQDPAWVQPDAPDPEPDLSLEDNGAWISMRP